MSINRCHLDMSIEVGFTGDVMLGRLVNDRQQRRPPEAVWGDLYDRLTELHGLLINLECCIADRGQKWQRTTRPFHFRANPDWAIPALKRVDVDFCALANNHILDFEEVALRETLTHLSDAAIAHAGAGITLADALEPAFFRIGDIEIATLSFTDNTPEYGASETDPGTAYIEIDTENEQTKARVHTALDAARDANPELIIASLHWGPNMVERPPESFQRFGRWLIDQGVDLIHGHSAHVFQGVEVYDGAPILYDTGDFVDDYAVDDQLRNDRSFLFILSLTHGGTPVELRLEPIEITNCTVQQANSRSIDWSYDRMMELSAEFETEFIRDGDSLRLHLRS